MTLSVGSLCSGYEGLGLGLGMVLNTETEWLSEVDPSACAILDARYPGVPNIGDLTALDWSAVPPVDVLTAGYPCQPFSTAGRRQGANDARHLWPFIADAVGVLRPRLVVLENVSGHLSMGAAAVFGDLARLGYDARWTVVRASDVGACHRRARLFIVAAYPGGKPVRDGGHRPVPRTPGAVQGDEAEREWVRVGAGNGRADAPDTERSGRTGRARTEGRGQGRRVAIGGAGEGRTPTNTDDGASNGQRARPQSEQGSPDAADPHQAGPQGAQPAPRRDVPDWGAYGPAIARHAAAIGRSAPHPVDSKGRLNLPFVEWMMMLPAGWVTDIVTNRSKALKALGNGVVPPQAAYALRCMLT